MESIFGDRILLGCDKGVTHGLEPASCGEVTAFADLRAEPSFFFFFLWSSCPWWMKAWNLSVLVLQNSGRSESFSPGQSSGTEPPKPPGPWAVGRWLALGVVEEAFQSQSTVS